MYLKYFELSEFDCHETGENDMNIVFLQNLDKLREKCGFPFVITSGYRSKNHSLEIVKTKRGYHTYGVASDIAILNSMNRYKIIENAIDLGFVGIGIAEDFIHLDMRQLIVGPTTKFMWTYNK